MCTTCTFYLQYTPLIVLLVNLFFLSQCYTDYIHCTACNLHCCCTTYCWFSSHCAVSSSFPCYAIDISNITFTFHYTVPVVAYCLMTLLVTANFSWWLPVSYLLFVIGQCSPLYPLQLKQVTIEGVEEFFK